MRITTKGRVTIPANIRRRAGLSLGDEVDFLLDGDGVRIVPLTRDRGDGVGARLVAHLRGRGDSGMTTDEIMRLTRGDR